MPKLEIFVLFSIVFSFGVFAHGFGFSGGLNEFQGSEGFIKGIGSQVEGANVEYQIHSFYGTPKSFTVFQKNEIDKDAVIKACRELALQNFKTVIVEWGDRSKFRQVRGHVSVNLEDYRRSGEGKIGQALDAANLWAERRAKTGFRVNYQRDSVTHASDETYQLDARISPFGSCQVPSAQEMRETLEDYMSRVQKVEPAKAVTSPPKPAAGQQ